MRWTLRRSDALFVALAVALVALYVHASGGGFPLDDAWIHQTYGRNFAQSGRWEFTQGVPSAASTSPMYTLLLALGYRLGVDYALWTHGLGALALAAAAMLGARMAERLAPGQKFAPLATGLVILLTWHHLWGAAAGMETMLFGTLSLALMTLAWREIDAGGRALARGVLFGALAAVTTLTRPEGIILVGMIGFVMLIVRPQGGLLRAVVWGLGAGAAFIVVVTPYLLYNVQLTGGLLPDTAAAKQAEYAPLLALPYTRRLLDMMYPLMAGGQLILVPAALYYVIGVLRRLRTERAALLYLVPLLWIAALIAVYAARLPAPYQHGRYFIPGLPGYMVAGVVGVVWILRDGRHSLIGRAVGRALAISTALTLVYFAFGEGMRAYVTDVRIINEEMVTAAQWVARNIPPDELLAVHDIGAVGYFAPRPILDTAGLVSPEVVPIILDGEKLWALLRERDARYFMGSPDQIPGGNEQDPRLCPLFTTGGVTSPRFGGPNMSVYVIVWDEVCSRRG